MEIVLALLLLFGGFMLGSVTTEQAGDDQRPSVFSSHGDETAGSHRPTQPMRRYETTGCRSGYRDLTVPYRSPIRRSGEEQSHCDGSRDCWNDPAGLPSPGQVNCADE